MSISRIIFVSPDLEAASVFYQRLFSPFTTGLGAKITLVYAIFLGLLLNFQGRAFFHSLIDKLSQKNTIFQAFFFITMILLLLLIRPGGVPPYLYFQF